MHYCEKIFFLYIHSALIAEKLNIPLLPLGIALDIISSKPEGDVKVTLWLKSMPERDRSSTRRDYIIREFQKGTGIWGTVVTAIVLTASIS